MPQSILQINCILFLLACNPNIEAALTDYLRPFFLQIGICGLCSLLELGMIEEVMPIPALSLTHTQVEWGSTQVGFIGLTEIHFEIDTRKEHLRSSEKSEVDISG